VHPLNGRLPPLIASIAAELDSFPSQQYGAVRFWDEEEDQELRIGMPKLASVAN
jgi:hypothetical protein